MKKLEEEYEEIHPKIYAFFMPRQEIRQLLKIFATIPFMRHVKTSHHIMAIPPYQLGCSRLRIIY